MFSIFELLNISYNLNFKTMNKYFKFSAALLALGFTSFSAIAQSDDAPNAQKDENIVIHKKSGADEKLTIVVDGDKITVNGKPLADFKDGDVQIMSTDGMPPMDDMVISPMPPGGVQMFDRKMTIHSNKAILGVMSEKADNGVAITSVTKGSAAEKAGLQKDDIITKVGDAAIANPDDLYKAIGKYNAGDKVNISYTRNGAANTTSAVLDKNKSEDLLQGNMGNDYNYHYNIAPRMRNFSYSWNDNKPRMGVEVQDTEDGNGIKITDVNDDDAPAAKAGLKEGDIITTINGTAVKSVDDLKTSLKNAKEGDSIAVQYLRDGKTQSTQIKFPKELKSADL
jgi:serine protease Do